MNNITYLCSNKSKKKMTEKEFAIRYTTCDISEQKELLKFVKTGIFDIKLLCQEIVKITHPKFDEKQIIENKHDYITYYDENCAVSIHDCSYLLIPHKGMNKCNYYERNDIMVFKQSYFRTTSHFILEKFYNKNRASFYKNLYAVLKKYDKNVKHFNRV